MEIELNEYREQNNSIDSFKLEYKGQDVHKLPEFRKWYEKAYQYVKNNNRRTDEYLLTIGYCDTCLSYVIFKLLYSYSYAKCIKCNTYSCLGCSRKQEKYDGYDYHINNGGWHCDNTVCIKGYLKSFFLRAIHRRTNFGRTNPKFYIVHIIFCLFFTPSYIAFISNVMGLNMHSNRILDEDKFDKNYVFSIIFSFFRALLMFPYIITFFPFMCILLLPSIISHEYYLYVFNTYVTAIVVGWIYVDE